MKVLIWFLCIYGLGLLVTLLQIYGGAALGGIPSLLLFCGMMWLAKTLCLQWDIHCMKKNARAEGLSLYQYVARDVQYVARDVSPEILQELEKMEGRYDNTHAYLKKCRSQHRLTKPQAKVLEEAYVNGTYRTVESGSGRKDAAVPQKTASPDPQAPGVSEATGGIQMTRHTRGGRGDSSAD